MFMANTKYKLAKGASRSPEEHRKILQEIDALQNDRSRKGVVKSKKRIARTGISSTMYKKEHKPTKQKKERIYDQNRFIQNMGRTDYRD